MPEGFKTTAFVQRIAASQIGFRAMAMSDSQSGIKENGPMGNRFD